MNLEDPIKMNSNKKSKYEKNVDRVSNLVLGIVVFFIIVVTWFLTNAFFSNQTANVIAVPKSKKIDISNIKEAKLVKEYEDIETIESFDYIEFGKYNGKNIEWIVLKADKGEALIMSKYVLKSSSFADKDKKALWENWWEISNVKQWLNEEFYSGAFTDEEKEQIIEKGVVNKEKITILDNKEIKKYFGNNGKEIVKNHTKTMLFPGVIDSNIDLSDGYVPYWTKTDKKNRISSVKGTGELNEDGYKPTNNRIGIRPVIYIKY